jgi:hypothetical protein
MYGYMRGVPEKEFRIYNALKLKRKKIKYNNNVLATYFSDSKIIRNACNDLVTWS